MKKEIFKVAAFLGCREFKRFVEIVRNGFDAKKFPPAKVASAWMEYQRLYLRNV